MKCYNVTCIDRNGNRYGKGVMTDTPEHAKSVAEKAFLEGQHLCLTAVSVEEVNGI